MDAYYPDNLISVCNRVKYLRRIIEDEIIVE